MPSPKAPGRKSGPGTRRLSRELALKLLFLHDQNGGRPEETVKLFETCFDPKSDEECALELDEADFARGWPLAREFFFGVVAHLAEIDAAVGRAAHNWSLARMSPVDRGLIRLAYYEMRWREDIPPKASLNEALEIAKCYGDDDSVAFINGVLDRLLRELSRGAFVSQ